MSQHLAILLASAPDLSAKMPLQDLPLDVYMCICYFMDPLGILFLSQTCSSLRAVARERFLWWNATEWSITRNHVFGRAFKTHTMDLEELQDVATAPSRVLLNLRKGSTIDADVDRTKPIPASMYPHTTCLIRASDLQHDPRVEYESQNRKDWRYFEHVWVIPGGRFILAYTNGEVLLYDLRRLTPLKYRGQPLRVPCAETRLGIPSPSVDGREIRLAIGGNEWLQCDVTIIRFLFEEGDDTPTVIRHSTSLDPLIEGLDQIQLFLLTQDLFICYYTPRDATIHDILYVWDYKQDVGAAWKVVRRGYKKIYFDNDHIVLITSSALMGWLIPPLHRRYPNQRLHEVPPTFTTTLACDIEPADLHHCETLSEWYNPTSPSFFDMMSRTSSDTIHTWITFVPQDPITSYLASKRYTCHAKSWFFVGSYPNITSSWYTLCNDYVVKTFVGRPGRIFVLTSPVPDRATGNRSGDSPIGGESFAELVLPSEYQFNPGFHKPGLFSFDPTSGKLAYIWGRDQLAIVVVDYLKHPSEV